MTNLPRNILEQRLVKPPGNLLDIRTDLRHFALITYALPKRRLEPYIPADRFEIVEFDIAGQPMALLSAVPFWDADFRYTRLAPFLKFQFGQTNHRVYVIDRQTGQHAAWFFGTTLGSPIVYGARWLWRIPWHMARYQVDCRYNEQRGRYEQYEYRVQSDWCAAAISLADTGEPVTAVEGFATLDDWKLILTHPVEGFFYRLDGRLGTYSVWHEEIPLTVGQPLQLHFSLYERLGLLSPEEMQRPHSIFICPKVTFEVYLPPRKLSAISYQPSAVSRQPSGDVETDNE